MENQEMERPQIYGILGACLGGVCGGVAYILLGMLSGIYAALSSMVFAYCTLRFYRHFGGKRGMVGLIICSLSMVVFGFLFYSLDWMIACMQAYAVGLWDALRVVFLGVIKTGEFWTSLLFLYAFMAVCTWSLLFSAKKLSRTED